MNDDGASASTDVATQVSDVLKVAFEAVVTSTLSADEKGRWHRRLIAITNTTKHDVGRAHQQLQRFCDEWNGLDTGKEIMQ